MKRPRILLSALLLAGAVVAAAAYWAQLPKTPRELFEKRCSHCHALPDLSGYRRDEIAPLVSYMRTNNGAGRVISDAEAVVIIGYLEGVKETEALARPR